jgi:hypothetical protein
METEEKGFVFLVCQVSVELKQRQLAEGCTSPKGTGRVQKT